MTEPDRRRGGGKLARSETVTVRLDPKLRYLAELAALKHRRTLSSFIEWAIEDSLRHTNLRTGGFNESEITVADEAESLWDVDDADRFIKLALRYPELLNHEEQKRWKLIRENGFLWRGHGAGAQKKWEWVVEEDSIIYERLREHWPAFCAVARGEAKPDALPTWIKFGAVPSSSKPAPPPDFDDIPF